MHKFIFSETSISLVTGITFALVLTGLRKLLPPKPFRNTLLVLLSWITLLTILSLSGFFADFSALPPRVGLALILPLPIVLYIALSPAGARLLQNTPPHWLVYLQTFRIGVELVLWLSFWKGLIPVQMSFEGRNFDVLSGLLALPVGYYCLVKKKGPRWILPLYNIAGLLLLLNIIIIAVLSMPTPLRYFHNEPANTAVGHFPFIFLPTLLVPLAYTLHIFSLRQYILTRAPLTQFLNSSRDSPPPP